MNKLTGTWYHGSTLIFTNFRIPQKHSPSEQMGFGTHFAKNKDFASLYGSYIYHCRLHPESILDVSEGMLIAPGDPMDKFAKAMFKRGTRPYFIDKEHYVFGEEAIDSRHPKQAEAIIREYGYDAVVYRAKYGTRDYYGMHISNETLAVTMLNPSQIEIVDVETP